MNIATCSYTEIPSILHNYLRLMQLQATESWYAGSDTESEYINTRII